MVKHVFKSLIFVILLTLLNCIILVGTFFLPIDEMRNNIGRSSELFNFEGIYPQWATGYKSTQLDGWTEAAVYGMAIFQEGGAPLKNAMEMRYIEVDDLPTSLALTNYANHADKEYQFPSYGRYWYGSVAIIKVLLLFFDVADIRVINCIIQFSLILLIIAGMIKMGLEKWVIPLVAGLFIVDPISMSMSLTYSSDYYPMLFGIIAVLFFHKRIEKFGWIEFYAILGAITAFFSMLSFPLIALGFPMMIKLWVDEENWEKGTYFKDTFLLSAVWAVAYGVTWAMKWIIGSLVTGVNFFGNAFNQMSDYYWEDISVFDRVFKNVSVIMKWPYLLLVVFAIALIIMFTIKNKSKIDGAMKAMPSFTFMVMIPFIMIIMLGNGYAYVHYWMSFRQLGISVTAFLCIVVKCCEGLKHIRK